MRPNNSLKHLSLYVQSGGPTGQGDRPAALLTVHSSRRFVQCYCFGISSLASQCLEFSNVSGIFERSIVLVSLARGQLSVNSLHVLVAGSWHSTGRCSWRWTGRYFAF